jgi:hypothetical protein
VCGVNEPYDPILPLTLKGSLDIDQLTQDHVEKLMGVAPCVELEAETIAPRKTNSA